MCFFAVFVGEGEHDLLLLYLDPPPTSFPIWIPFSLFSSLIVIARTSKTMLNKSGESGHHCLVPDLSRNTFSFSPLSRMVAVSLPYMAFIKLR